jgi:hypothetical protein
MTEEENKTTPPKTTFLDIIRQKISTLKEANQRVIENNIHTHHIKKIEEKEVEVENKSEAPINSNPKHQKLKIFFIVLLVLLFLNISYIFYITNYKKSNPHSDKEEVNYVQVLEAVENTTEKIIIEKIILEKNVTKEKTLAILKIEDTIEKPLENAIDHAIATLEEQERKVIKEKEEALKAQRMLIAKEEAQKILLAKEEAKKALLAEEEAQKALLAEEEAQKALLAKEEAQKALIAKEEAQKALLAEEEAQKALLAKEEAQKALIVKEEAQKALIIKEEAQKESIPSPATYIKEPLPIVPQKNLDDYIEVIEMRSVGNSLKVTHRKNPLSQEEKERQKAKELLLEQMQN